jgi:hypothetical protein
MSSSWWDIGDWGGRIGNDLALYQIACPFCFQQGNFTLTHREFKEHPRTKKILYYDIYNCGNCGNYLMVFWSAATSGGHTGIHDYRMVPWPKKIEKYPDHWPEDVGRSWLQAHGSLDGENWDAAAMMARTAVQLATRYHNATGNNLKQEIDSLADSGVLPPIMREWSHEVRELGNDAAHPVPGATGTTPNDAKDVVRFLDYLLRFLYSLPHEIKQYRERKKGSG